MHSLDFNNPRHQQSQLFSGLILLLSVLVVAVDFAWFFQPSGAFLVQAPILLLAVGCGMLAGLVYLPRPHSWVGPLLLGLVFISLEFTIRGSQGQAQTLVKGMIGLSMLIFGIFQSRRTFHHSSLTLFFGYGLVCLVSMGYSSTMALTVGAGITVMGICFMATTAASTDGPGLMKYWVAMYWFAVFACLSSFALLAVAPGLATDYANAMGSFRLAGVLGAGNILGPTMAAGMMVALLMIKRSRSRKAFAFHWLMFISMAVALGLTLSRTAIVGSMGAIIVAALLRGALGIMSVLGLLIAAVIMVFIVTQPEMAHRIAGLLGNVFARSGHYDELTSFTGRTDIWRAAWSLFLERPWFGFGLGSTRVELPRLYSDEWGNPQLSTHNFLLEALTNVGIVGTGLLLACMAVVAWRLARFIVKNRQTPASELKEDGVRDFDMAVCGIRILVFVTIDGLMEKGLAGTPTGGTVAFCLSTATCAYLSFKYNEKPAGFAPPTSTSHAFSPRHAR